MAELGRKGDDSMTEKQIQDSVAQAIAETPLSRERYYHICWWEDRLQCLHARHTKDVHDAFYSAPGEVFIEGLSAYQWRLLTDRVIDFCRTRRISLSACSEGSNSKPGPGPCGQTAQVTDFDSTRLRAMLADIKPSGSVRDNYLHRLRELLNTADTVPPHDVPANVVTMNSRIRLRDKHDTQMTVSLAFPEDAGRA